MSPTARNEGSTCVCLYAVQKASSNDCRIRYPPKICTQYRRLARPELVVPAASHPYLSVHVAVLRVAQHHRLGHRLADAHRLRARRPRAVGPRLRRFTEPHRRSAVLLAERAAVEPQVVDQRQLLCRWRNAVEAAASAVEEDETRSVCSTTASASDLGRSWCITHPAMRACCRFSAAARSCADTGDIGSGRRGTSTLALPNRVRATIVKPADITSSGGASLGRDTMSRSTVRRTTAMCQHACAPHTSRNGVAICNDSLHIDDCGEQRRNGGAQTCQASQTARGARTHRSQRAA